MPSTPPFKSEDLPDLSDRIIFVTGGNVGLGLQSIIAFAKKGAKVYMGCRNETKANNALEEIKTEVPGARVEFISLDLGNLESIKTAAETYKRKESTLHVLLNNAGVMALPPGKTSDGYDNQFGVNHLGHFALTRLLLPTLEATAKTAPPNTVRIVNVSSLGHLGAMRGIDFSNDVKLEGFTVTTWERYGVSKLSNILHSKALARRYTEAGIISVSCHPGVVSSALYDSMLSNSVLMKYGWEAFKKLSPVVVDTKQGSLTQVYLAASEKVTKEDSGDYYVPTAQKGRGCMAHSRRAGDENLQDQLWGWSEEQMKKHGL